MNKLPTLQTSRLHLRPFTLDDAARVQLLAGDARIAAVTANVPHPYLDGMAERWISTHQENWERGELASFAVTQKSSGLLIGCVSIMRCNQEPEIGYWIGVEYWNKGYATEACVAISEFATSALTLTRLCARHLSRNPASGRVLLKAGFSHVGSQPLVVGSNASQDMLEIYETLLAPKLQTT
jgi:[ribosomal protein S5]-alanine N-acetyltransferase